MLFDFLIHDVVRVEYRVVIDEATPHLAHIQSETRLPGGNGALMALVLAKWGARVRLVGNPIGDDSHGRFLRQSLGAVANLDYQPELQTEIVTPYAILLRSHQSVQTLLSPSATQVALLWPSGFVDEARTFIGPELSSTSAQTLVDESRERVIAPQTQDYDSLKRALKRAARGFLDWKKPDWPLERQHAFVDEALRTWDERFSALSAIPDWEEIEAPK